MTGTPPLPGETAVRTGNLTAAEALARGSRISDVRYTVAIDLTRGDLEFGCRTAIRFRSAADGSTFLDYAGTVRRIECNGRPLTNSAHDGSRVHMPDRRGETTVYI